MKVLELRAPGTTDAVARELPALKQDTHPILLNSAVTDAGLKDVARMPALTHLHLDGSEGMTDAGLDALAGLKGLGQLCLLRTGWTDGGVKKPAAARPDVRIQADGGPVGPKGSGGATRRVEGSGGGTALTPGYTLRPLRGRKRHPGGMPACSRGVLAPRCTPGTLRHPRNLPRTHAN